MLTAYDDDSFSILGIAYFAAMWLRRVGAGTPAALPRSDGSLVGRANSLRAERIECVSWEIVST
jgi:hypothetical protein